MGAPQFPQGLGGVGQENPQPMLGEEPTQAKPTDVQDTVRAAMTQFGKINTQIESLARQFPETAKDARKAAEAVRAMMMAVTSNMTRQQGGQNPPILG